jgi:hypothetical protein
MSTPLAEAVVSWIDSSAWPPNTAGVATAYEIQGTIVSSYPISGNLYHSYTSHIVISSQKHGLRGVNSSKSR